MLKEWVDEILYNRSYRRQCKWRTWKYVFKIVDMVNIKNAKNMSRCNVRSLYCIKRRCLQYVNMMHIYGYIHWFYFGCIYWIHSGHIHWVYVEHIHWVHARDVHWVYAGWTDWIYFDYIHWVHTGRLYWVHFGCINHLYCINRIIINVIR